MGVSAEHKPGENIGYSLDSGHTWKPTTSQPTPNSRAGSIAVSPDGSTWVWTPEHESPSVTRNSGASWNAVQGLPAGTRIVADPADPNIFYAISLPEHTFYISNDAAASFTSQPFTLENAPPPSNAPRGDPRGGQDRLYATPGRKGDLWFAAFDGLYHLAATPANPASFTRLPGVTEIQAFGFGKAAPGRSYPALYLVGTVRGQAGIFRSTDEARTWVRINDDQHQWGLILQITGDPRLYGRVYLGTHGRGILYGDPLQRSSSRKTP